MLFVAILTGAASLLNYAWWASFELTPVLRVISIAAQAVLTAATVFAAVRYRGKRLRMSYDYAGYKVFTVPFALIWLSLIGNISVLIVLVLKAAGVIQNL